MYRRTLTGLLLATTLAACAESRRDAEARAAARAELIVRSLMTAFETADTALVHELFSPVALYDDFPNQHTYRGIGEIVGYVTGLHAWADDVVINVVAVHPTTGGAVAEWVFSAVHARAMTARTARAGGVPGTGVARMATGTGREVVLNGVTVLELDGERIVRAADYADTGAMLLQLGARVELPDGTTLQLDGGR